MKEKHTDSIQNRFTAYLVAAVGNTRKKYWEQKYRLQDREATQENLLEWKYTENLLLWSWGMFSNGGETG